MLLSKAANEEHHNLFIIQEPTVLKATAMPSLMSKQDYHRNKTAEKQIKRENKKII